MNLFENISDFFGCILQESCKYSIKKILAYTFSILIIYLAIYTDKNYYELLVFVGVLVGVRTYERIQSWKNPEGGTEDIEGMKMGSSKKSSNRPSKKRILTD